MPKGHTHLTPDDRCQIEVLLRRGDNLREIGRFLGRPAVGGNWRGQGVGLSLFKDAILRALDVAAKAFYQRLGFQDGFINPVHINPLTKDLMKITASQ